MKRLIAKILLVAMIISVLACLSACGNGGSNITIGENGNWFIDGTDTGVSATGPKGETGEAGQNGTNGTSTGTPSFRFNVITNCYEVSFDSGETWVAIENYDPSIGEAGDSNNNNNESTAPTTYEYPVDTIIPVSGAVAYATDHKFIDYNNYEVAYIDLAGLDYDSVSFDIADDHVDPWVCFAFITEMPTKDSKVSYADGYSTFKFACYDCTVDIPENANYLMFYYSDGEINYLPAGITFTKGKTALDYLQDESLDSYDYPMQNLVADHAVIRYYDNGDSKFLYVNDYKVAFIDITDTAFNYVILTPADRDDQWMGYAFVTKMPKIDEVASYATGYTTFKTGNYEIEIPSDAKYLVVYYMDAYDELYYPGAIRFEK